MTASNKRTKVRLRLERGAARLSEPSVGAAVCELIDISESGCACRLVLSRLESATASLWRAVLLPSRMLTLDISDALNLAGFIVPECQVRWIQSHRTAEIVFGVSFSSLSEHQKATIAQGLMTLAALKLRAPQGPQSDLPAPDKAAPAAKHPSRLTTVEGIRSMRRKFEPYANPPPVLPPANPPAQLKPQEESSEPIWRAGRPVSKNSLWTETQSPDRQKRHGVSFPIAYDFTDAHGKQLSTAAKEGLVRDFNEGGFLIEGEGPEFCSALELQARGAGMLATLQVGAKQLAAKLEILSVKHSPTDGIWRYGVRIIEMPESDRALLRELYIRASLTAITRKRG